MSVLTEYPVIRPDVPLGSDGAIHTVVFEGRVFGHPEFVAALSIHCEYDHEDIKYPTGMTEVIAADGERIDCDCGQSFEIDLVGVSW